MAIARGTQISSAKPLRLMVSNIKNKTYQHFARRLHTACDRYGLPANHGRATALGKIAGVSYKGAGKWLDAMGMPDMGHAAILAKALDVPFEWLMTGRGSENLVHGVAESAPSYTSDSGELLLCRNMPPPLRSLLHTFVSSLAQTVEKNPGYFLKSKSDLELLRRWKRDLDQFRTNSTLATATAPSGKKSSA